jgi:hypothetical protein
MFRNSSCTALAAVVTCLLPSMSPAARAATPVFTPIVQVYCAFEGDCVPEIPVTQMLELSPGNFIYVGMYGVIYSFDSSGAYSQRYVINDNNTWNSAPLQASDGNLYFASSLGNADIVELSPKLKLIQNLPTPAFAYSVPLVETPDGLLHGASITGFADSGNDFTLQLSSGTITTLPQTVSTSQLFVSAAGDLYGVTPSGVLKFASDGSYTNFANVPNAVAGMIEASDGNFYVCNGVLNRVTPQGAVTPLTNVSTAYGCVIQASDGLFYGAMQDHVYRASIDGSQVTDVYDFNGFDDGQQTSQFVKTIIQASDGKLYGETTGNIYAWKINYNATIWSLDLGLPKPKPAITRVAGALPRGGLLAMLTGHYFLGTTSVTVNGEPVRFKVRAAEYLEIALPRRIKSGTVVVTTPNGSVSSAFSLGKA